MPWGAPFEAAKGSARLAVFLLEDEEPRRVTGFPPQGTVRMLGEGDCEVGIQAAEAEEGYAQTLGQVDQLTRSLSQPTQQRATRQLHRSNLEGPSGVAHEHSGTGLSALRCSATTELLAGYVAGTSSQIRTAAMPTSNCSDSRCTYGRRRRPMAEDVRPAGRTIRRQLR